MLGGKRATVSYEFAIDSNTSELHISWGGGLGGGVEYIILIRHSRTVFSQSNHKVFLIFSVSLFILLTSALNLPHQYLADNKLQHSFIILTNFE